MALFKFFSTNLMIKSCSCWKFDSQSSSFFIKLHLD